MKEALDGPPKEEVKEEVKEDVSETANKTAKRLQRTLNFLTVATVGLAVFLIGASIWVYIDSKENTKSLCALRDNAQARIDQTDQFLKEHPEGFQGISAAELERAQATSKTTVRALGGLDCPPALAIPQN